MKHKTPTIRPTIKKPRCERSTTDDRIARIIQRELDRKYENGSRRAFGRDAFGDDLSSSLRQWLNGSRTITLSRLDRLADALDMQVTLTPK